MPPKISSMTHQGSRSHQDDRLVIKRVDAKFITGMLLGVADGHGGDDTSSFIESQLSQGLFDKMLIETRRPIDALNNTFEHLNDATLELSRSSGAHAESGSTLSLVYIPDDQTESWVGIIGDSPVIHVRQDGTVHLSPEHNARSNEEERKGAEQRGGFFKDGYIYSKSSRFALQMTRDLGCHAMGNVLRRVPDIYNLLISDGDLIIVASDGLVDPRHSNTWIEANKLARLVLDGAEAKELVDYALSRETGDNIAVIVYRCMC